MRLQGQTREAIWFGRVEPVSEHVRLAYRLSLDEWNGQQRVQMVDEAQFDTFDAALQLVATEWLDSTTLTRRVRTDGPLALEYFNAPTVALLDTQVWGQAFEPPLFCDEVEVLAQRLVADKHLKLRVRLQGQTRDAIWFGHVEPVGERVRLAYRLSLDEWNGQQRVQMVVEACG